MKPRLPDNASARSVQRLSTNASTADADDDRALRDQLTDDSRPTGAEAKPDGDLALAIGRAREHQPRDVETRDEKDGQRRANQRRLEESLTVRRSRRVGGRDVQRCTRRTRRERGIDGGELAQREIDLRLSQFGRLSWHETAIESQPSMIVRGEPCAAPRHSRSAHRERGPHRDGEPDIGTTATHAAEVSTRDADDGERRSVRETEHTTQRRRVADEARFPESVIEHADVLLLVGRTKRASKSGRRTQCDEIVARHQLGRDPLRLAVIGGRREQYPLVGARDERRQRRRPHTESFIGGVRPRLRDRDERARLVDHLHRQDSVDRREDRRIEADAEHEAHDRDDAECRRFDESARAVPGVLRDLFDPTHAARIACLFLDTREVAEFALCFRPGVDGREASRDEPFGRAIEVIAQLVVHLAFNRVAPQQRARPRAQSPNHRGLP
jgi:hypothetical protein